VLAVGSWLVGEHADAVAAVVGSLRQFLMWGRKWPEHGIMGASAMLCILFIFFCVIPLACDIERVWGSLGFVGQTSRRQNTSE
jgi:hypothetical protein